MEIQDDKYVENGDISPQIPIDEKGLVRKIDLRIIPCLGGMYLLTFLDRINIGNAAVLGLREELNITTGTRYNAALMIFFVPYIFFEMPSNVFLRKLKPHVWLSFLMFAFGVVTICQGLVQSWSGLMATRWFLGMLEAGMFPGCVYLLGTWYKRDEAQKRYTIYFGCTSLAGAFGGLLASAIGKMDGVQGYRGWRWIFILEGLATCIVGIVNYSFIPDFPDDCDWLSDNEREFCRERLEMETGKVAAHVKMGWREILGVFKDYKIFIGGMMTLGNSLTGYGYAYFAPTIIHTYGYGAIKSQLYSVPPWVVALVCSIGAAFLSDRLRHRYLFAVLPLFVSVAGYGILLNVKDTAHHHLQYGALYMIMAGSTTSFPILLCWFSMNLGGHLRKSVGAAWQISFGNIGGIIATFAFLEKDAPLYRNGYIIVLSFMCFSMLASSLYFLSVWCENRRRGRALDGGVLQVTEEDEQRLGDLACTYRYAY